jgi:hypothetical protein
MVGHKRMRMAVIMLVIAAAGAISAEGAQDSASRWNGLIPGQPGHQWDAEQARKSIQSGSSEVREELDEKLHHIEERKRHEIERLLTPLRDQTTPPKYRLEPGDQTDDERQIKQAWAQIYQIRRNIRHEHEERIHQQVITALPAGDDPNTDRLRTSTIVNVLTIPSREAARQIMREVAIVHPATGGTTSPAEHKRVRQRLNDECERLNALAHRAGETEIDAERAAQITSWDQDIELCNRAVQTIGEYVADLAGIPGWNTAASEIDSTAQRLTDAAGDTVLAFYYGLADEGQTTAMLVWTRNELETMARIMPRLYQRARAQPRG